MMKPPPFDPPEKLPFDIRRQPDDTTCGPTCLHGVYGFYGDAVPLNDLLKEVPALEEGGTLGVLLANHALARGYRVTIVTCNLQVFDPTWFVENPPPMRERLIARMDAKRDSRTSAAIQAYVEFLDQGGKIELRELTASLIRTYLKRGVPVMTGLSATFLYREPREIPLGSIPDDVRGDPAGHFVVLTGYLAERREVYVTDPLHPNPLAPTHTYPVPIERLVGAIYLGVLTHDANLIAIEPGPPLSAEKARANRPRRQ